MGRGSGALKRLSTEKTPISYVYKKVECVAMGWCGCARNCDNQQLMGKLT